MASRQESAGSLVAGSSDQPSQPSSPPSPTHVDTRTPEVEQDHRRHDSRAVESERPQESDDALPHNSMGTDTSGELLQSSDTNSESSTAAPPHTPETEPQIEPSSPTIAGSSTTIPIGSANPSIARQIDQPNQHLNPQSTMSPTRSANPVVVVESSTPPRNPTWNHPNFAHLDYPNRTTYFVAFFGGQNGRTPPHPAWNCASLAHLPLASRAMYLALLFDGSGAQTPRHALWSHPNLAHLSVAARAMLIAQRHPLTPLGSFRSRTRGPSPFNEEREWENLYRNGVEHMRAPWPVRYGDPYDKLIGPPSSLRTDVSLQPYRDRHEFVHMTNRVLLQTRQARVLAGLDTRAMDEEVVYRIQKKPEQWTARGYELDRDAGFFS